MLATERHNLLNYYPGRNGKGDAFPIKSAIRSAEKLEKEFPGKRIIFLGHAVASCFDCNGAFFEWHRKRIGFGSCYQHATIPHPSGINRWWNDEKNRARAAKFLNDAFAFTVEEKT